ncbi:MAG: iron-sulfur cluster assembly accessory protein [Planctomycetota bacterium]|nr:MAG: iron-sulfur cluster assembly accessory protein [Planctomycetota bacterium]
MSISITEKAVEEIQRLMKQQELPQTAGVRVGVKGGGCSGFSYSLNFDLNQAESDLVFEDQGVRIFCDPKSHLYLQGTTLDFTDGLNGKGFQFVNPNASNTCGCGESFSV